MQPYGQKNSLCSETFLPFLRTFKFSTVQTSATNFFLSRIVMKSTIIPSFYLSLLEPQIFTKRIFRLHILQYLLSEVQTFTVTLWAYEIKTWPHNENSNYIFFSIIFTSYILEMLMSVSGIHVAYFFKNSNKIKVCLSYKVRNNWG